MDIALESGTKRRETALCLGLQAVASAAISPSHFSLNSVSFMSQVLTWYCMFFVVNCGCRLLISAQVKKSGDEN